MAVAMLLTTGKLLRITVGDIRELHDIEAVAHALLHLATRLVLGVEDVSNILGSDPVVVQVLPVKLVERRGYVAS